MNKRPKYKAGAEKVSQRRPFLFMAGRLKGVLKIMQRKGVLRHLESCSKSPKDLRKKIAGLKKELRRVR